MRNRTVVNFTPRQQVIEDPAKDSANPGHFDEAAERCEIILAMSQARDDIEKIASRLFDSFAFPIRDAQRINEHLMDAKKSIAAAVAAMPTRSK